MADPREAKGSGDKLYQRPAQKWVCGHAAEGKPCRIGPDHRGACRATYECTPRATEPAGHSGRRYRCTRPPEYGGPCRSGPRPDGTCSRPIAPCLPVRSLRARRGVLTIWTLAAAAGTLMVVLAGPWRLKFIEPGELSAPHRSLKVGPQAGEAQCAVCHEEALAGPVQWTAAFWRPEAAQSERCLSCHDLGANPMWDHGLPPGHMRVLRERAEADDSRSGRPSWLLTMASTGSGIARTRDGTLACATCHKEHHGRTFNIAHLDNNQCQVCHTKPFRSLAQGHPEFKKRETRIHFNHTTHIKDYFQKPGSKPLAPTACESCHTPDPGNRYMLTGTYEQNCAACHDASLRQQLLPDEKGMAVLSLPALDLSTLRDQKLPIGDSWPADEDEGYEGELNPFMTLFLSSTPGMTNHLARVTRLDLLDLSGNDKDECESVVAVAKGITTLFESLATEGAAGLMARTGAALGITLSEQDADNLTVGLSAAMLKDVRRAWWPKEGSAADAKATVAAEEVATGWYRDDFDRAIRYKPAGHADPLLHAWLDLLGENYGGSGPAGTAFDAMTTRPQFQSCLKCHSVHAPMEQGRRSIRWLTKRSAHSARDFTKFNHALHFKLMSQYDCLQCHHLSAETEFQTGFKPRPKAECTSCHTPKQAGDNCLLCHNYHIAAVTPALAQPTALKWPSGPEAGE